MTDMHARTVWRHKVLIGPKMTIFNGTANQTIPTGLPRAAAETVSESRPGSLHTASLGTRRTAVHSSKSTSSTSWVFPTVLIMLRCIMITLRAAPPLEDRENVEPGLQIDPGR